MLYDIDKNSCPIYDILIKYVIVFNVDCVSYMHVFLLKIIVCHAPLY